MKKDALNIYDIAEMAKVSIATVSRVVNGSEKVSEATRKKVLAVIDEVGYTPNVFAQGLGLKTMHTVGILVPTIADHYMASAVAYLEKELMKYGYDCILSCSGFEAEGKLAKTDMLLSKHIDSLIFVGSTYAGDGSDESVTDYIRNAAKRVPVFIINGDINGENVYATVSGDEEAVYEAAKQLIAGGRRNIIFITDSRSYSSNQKRKGYERAMKEAGLDTENGTVYVENDFHAVRDALTELGGTYDGVISANDNIAVGVVKYAVSKGLSIPEDIEIIGYNNSMLAMASTPEITSIDNHTADVCRDTVERIMHVLDEDGDTPAQKIAVKCDLIPRETTVRR